MEHLEVLKTTGGVRVLDLKVPPVVLPCAVVIDNVICQTTAVGKWASY
uniref:Uncharacterized protein n=1 Tax=Anguilla anguilla TaxID=7936 RepID=A0A0E9RR05_ANGAN